MISSLGTHALKALVPQTAVSIDRSRCARHRCNRNKCRQCIDVCKTAAIIWNEQGLSVAPGRCTQCLSCLAVCPTAALRSPELALLQVLTDLAAHQKPVLSCVPNPVSKKHACFACLGYLAHPEVMLLFALVFTEGVQFDLTHCRNCPNHYVLANIHAAYAVTERLLPDNNARLIIEENELNYQPASLSRRELFSFFRERSSRTAAIMVERLQVRAKTESYGNKQVPLVRALLLKAMESLPASQQRQLTSQLFGQISFTSTCTACGGCVGVCPTGAIDTAESDQPNPGFDQRRCVGCRSCEAFCRKQGIRLAHNHQDATSLTLA